MNLAEEFVVHAPVTAVWDFLFDLERVSRCMPGVERVEQIDPTHYRGTLGIKVGPIGASFQGDAELTQVEPPARVVALAQGRDGKTGSHVRVEFAAELQESAPGQTTVRYTMDVAIRGRLGQFGHGVIRETARRVNQQFAGCVQAALAGGEDASPPSNSALLSAVVGGVAASIGNRFRSGDKGQSELSAEENGEPSGEGEAP